MRLSVIVTGFSVVAVATTTFAVSWATPLQQTPTSAPLAGTAPSAAAQPAPSQPPQPYPPAQPYPAQPYPAQPYPTQPAPSAPSAGGLYAPDPLDPAAQRPPGDTQQSLDASKEADSGRGLSFFYIDVEGGYQYVGLETFDVDRAGLTAGLVETEASGGFIGAGLGVRLLSFTLGPRVRWGFFPDYQLFSVGGELGLRIPLGILEPNVSLGVGYSALGNLSDAVRSVPESITIDGVDVRVGAGLDVFLMPILSLGFGAAWEFLALTRPGVSLSDLNQEQQGDLSDAQRQALALEGSGYGSSVTIAGKLGLHF